MSVGYPSESSWVVTRTGSPKTPGTVERMRKISALRPSRLDSQVMKMVASAASKSEASSSLASQRGSPLASQTRFSGESGAGAPASQGAGGVGSGVDGSQPSRLTVNKLHTML